MRIPSLSKTAWSIIAFIAAFIAALVIRTIGLASEPLWLDEINTLLVATGHTHLPNGYPATLPSQPLTAEQWVANYLAWQPFNWSQLLGVLKENVHLPLYYLLVHPWVKWFGMGEASLRSISVIFSLVMIWPLWALGKKLTPTISSAKQPLPWWLKASLWIVLFAIANPFQLYFAQEARMYAMATCFTCFSALGLWQVAILGNRRWSWWLLYTLSTLLALFSHYMVWLQGIFHALVWVVAISRSQHKAPLIKRLLLACIILGIPVIGWIPMLKFQQAAPTLSGGEHFSEGLLKPIRYIGVLVWQPWMVMTGSNLWAKIVYIPLTTIGVLVSLWQALSTKNTVKLTKQWLWFVFAWAWLPLLAQIGVDLVKATHTSTIIRYGLLMGPPVMLLTAYGWAQLMQVIYRHKPSLSNLVSSALATVIIVIGVGTVWPDSPIHFRGKYPSRQMAEFLANNAKPDAAVVANGPLAAPLSLAYEIARYRPELPIAYYVSPYRNVDYPTPIVALSQNHSEIWLYKYRGGKERGYNQLIRDLRSIYPNRVVTGPENRWIGYYQ